MSGINDDPRMTYYEKVATNTNMYAYGVKKRGGTRGHIFRPTDAQELLVWDGIVCRNLNNNIAESWMMNQSNTFDQEISEVGGPGDPLPPFFFLKHLAGKSIQELQTFWW